MPPTLTPAVIIELRLIPSEGDSYSANASMRLFG
jgi:hypothetical protein